MKIHPDVIHFIQHQDYVIVSTLDDKGRIHSSAKGIVGFADKDPGKILLIDLFFNATYRNLKSNPTISITAIDGQKFIGYTFQGTASLILRENIPVDLLEEWENRIVSRISKRLIKNVQSGTKTKFHHEMALPRHPKYLIEATVNNIIDLSTHKIRETNKP